MARRSGAPVFELLFVFVLVSIVQATATLVDLVGGLFVLQPPVTENPWTVVTSVYAHANLGHLVSNAVALVLFGWPVARATTRIRFHAFFLVAGATAGVSQILVSNTLAELPVLGVTATGGVLGASGGVFALLGYLMASNPLSNGLSRFVSIPRWISYLVFLMVAAVLTYATASPGAALIAHFVGLLFGLVAGRFRALKP